MFAKTPQRRAGSSPVRRAPQLGQESERGPGDAHVVHRLVVAALRVHEVRRLEDVVERTVHLRAQGRRATLDRRLALDRRQRERGERELARGVVVVRGLRRVGERLQREHLRRTVDELGRDPVLRGAVESGTRVEPVEGERLPQEDEVPVRALDPAQLRLRQLRESLLRVRLVPREEIRERPAGQVVGRALALRVAGAQPLEPCEGIVSGDEQARVGDRNGRRGGRGRYRDHGDDEERRGRVHRGRPLRAATIASASARRAASKVSPVSAKPTVGPASEKTRGTTAASAFCTTGARPSWRAIVR